MTNPPEFIFLKDSKEKDVYHKVYFSEIYYISATGDYASIFTKDRRYVVYGSLVAWEERLPKGVFLRIHRSHIVQVHLIEKIEGNQILMNGYSLPIGESYKKDFFSNYQFL